jgi:hypothetical protein
VDTAKKNAPAERRVKAEEPVATPGRRTTGQKYKVISQTEN